MRSMRNACQPHLAARARIQLAGARRDPRAFLVGSLQSAPALLPNNLHLTPEVQSYSRPAVRCQPQLQL